MSEKEISEKMQDIIKRMKTRREELNMSYQTLSEKVGISKSTLQRYETGYINWRRSLTHLIYRRLILWDGKIILQPLSPHTLTVMNIQKTNLMKSVSSLNL